MASSENEQFSLLWKDFHNNIALGFHDLLSSGDLADVTLAAEGRILQAHKLVLSVCSPYFREMFKMNPTQHPIVFLKDVSHSALRDVLVFMYQGEVNVKEEELSLFMSTAEQLQVKGLSGEEISISNKAEKKHSQQQHCVKVKIEPISVDSVESKQLNRPSNKTSVLHSESAKRKCIDPLAAGPSKSRKEDFITVSVEEAVNASTSFEPEFVNESIWDKENEYHTNNDDTKLSDDSNVDITHEFSSGEEDNELPQILTTEEINEMTLNLPSKSKMIYVRAYENFMRWRISKKEESFSEGVLFSYFDELSKTLQPPSLQATYSMLKSIIKIRHNIDLKDYTGLLAFLKKISIGFKSKKTKIFTPQDVEKFLTKAPDKKFLATKVALIIGIAGACKCKELLNITVDDIETHGNFIIIKLKNPDSEREFVVRGGKYTDIIKKYLALRPDMANTKRLFINYQDGKCFRQVIGHNKISGLPKQIATYLGLPNPERYTGHCYRRTANSGSISSLRLH